MPTLIQILGGIAILSALIAGLAYIQSRGGEDIREKYRTRMRRFVMLAFVCCVLAGLLQMAERFV